MTQPTLGAPPITPLPIATHTSIPIPLGSAIEPELKVRIIKGLYVAIDVILVSEQGGNIDSYLHYTTHTPGKDSRNQTSYPTLNIDLYRYLGFSLSTAMLRSTSVHPPYSINSQKYTRPSLDSLQPQISDTPANRR